MDNADEQAAQVRRELDGRLHVAEDNAKVKIIQKIIFSFNLIVYYLALFIHEFSKTLSI